MNPNQSPINSYEDAQAAIKYLDFLHSENGQIQQKILSKQILKHLPTNTNSIILDAGCGPGWLAEELKNKFPNVYGSDSSDLFIKFAHYHHPGIEFKKADLNLPLPYSANFFDTVILNMVGPDLKNLNVVFNNLSKVLKPSGKLIMTVPNPEFSYPAAEWKRDWLDILLFKKPKLIKKLPPKVGEVIKREFGKNKAIASFYYNLDSYLKATKNSGFKFNQQIEIRSNIDSKKFDLHYQLYRYPLILLLEFTKT